MTQFPKFMPVVLLAVGVFSGCGDAEMQVADGRDDQTQDAGVDSTEATEIDDTGQPSAADLDAVDAVDAVVAVDGHDMPPDLATPDLTVDNSAKEVVMTFMTANIGREYSTRAQVEREITKLRQTLGPLDGPSFLGWQEIGEGDPCGNCEIEIVRGKFDGNWETSRPRGDRPDGGKELVKVPITLRGGGEQVVRAQFASPGWAGVSPTRFVSVVYSADRNISLINTHLIAGAWSCKSQVAKRKQYWRDGWKVLQNQVAREHDRGRNVVVTGDLNRPRGANNCNPQWDPTSLHARAQIVGGVGIDYIFAVPAAGQKFKVATKNGAAWRGSVNLTIDSHNGHWVRGSFSPR